MSERDIRVALKLALDRLSDMYSMYEKHLHSKDDRRAAAHLVKTLERLLGDSKKEQK